MGVLDTQGDRGETQSMRVVGYARELPDRSHGGSIFAQSERIRRWTTEQGYQLLAMCQDVRNPSGEGSEPSSKSSEQATRMPWSFPPSRPSPQTS